MPDTPRQPSTRLMLGLIICGLALWALYVAVGAFFYDLDIRKSIAVLVCMAVFIGFWLLLLWTQNRTPKP